MILLGDIGNSRQKWRAMNGAVLGRVQRFDVRDVSALASFFGDQSHRGVTRVVVSHVGGAEQIERIEEHAHQAGLPEPEWVATPAGGQGPGLRVGYRSPGQLGVDRYLAMLGARDRYRGPLVVIDCGTAVTIDAVDHEGRHLGGAIFPGLRLMSASLAQGTTQVQVDWAATDAMYGRDTAECVGLGTLHAVAGGIESLVQTMGAGLEGAPVRVLTGGDAELVEPLLKARYHSHPDLVLDGLAIHAGI